MSAHSWCSNAMHFSVSFRELKVHHISQTAAGDERNVEITELHVANWFRNRRKVKKVIDVNGPKCE